MNGRKAPVEAMQVENVTAFVLVYGSGLALVCLAAFALVKVGKWATR